MSTITDAQVEAGREAFDAKAGYSRVERIRAAIEAALSVPVEQEPVADRIDALERNLSLAIEALKSVAASEHSLELAETELRRANNAGQQPRMQNAGNRKYLARIRLARAAHFARTTLAKLRGEG